MSIELTSLSFGQKDLTPSEKHILMILSFRADSKTFECFPSFSSLMHDSGYSRDTVNRVMSSLRNKKKIVDTGSRRGRTKSIIVYKIVIHKHSDNLIFIPQKQSDGAPKESDDKYVKQSDGKYRKDHIIKDHRKDRFPNPKTQKIKNQNHSNVLIQFEDKENKKLNNEERKKIFLNSQGPKKLADILKQIKATP